MKTTLTIDRDGTAHIPMVSPQSGIQFGIMTIAQTRDFAIFAEKNELRMGEVLSEDTMEIFLKDHAPRTTLSFDRISL